jgi:hypothetical protein
VVLVSTKRVPAEQLTEPGVHDSTCRQMIEEDVVETTTIGVDLGVTSASDVAVAEGATVTGSRRWPRRRRR